jgi:hypothetical protein|tara:strand:+ start:96 stop:764 length:669 start_codon:yes stop_codon:yes gene_type:complete
MKLDFIENIEIYKGGITPLTNYHSIPQLKEGIFMVYIQMKNLQNNYWKLRYPNLSDEQLEIHKKTSFSMSGELNQVDAQAVNLFHWYSINLVNYAKCCGLVKFLNEKKVLPEYLAKNKDLIEELSETQKKYLNGIPELEPVRHFRNKAGAHLAFTDPNKKYDNPATLIESMSIIPTLINGKITIGGMTRKRGESVSSFSKYEWNLIDNFDSLIPRYFKNNFG